MDGKMGKLMKEEETDEEGENRSKGKMDSIEEGERTDGERGDQMKAGGNGWRKGKTGGRENE